MADYIKREDAIKACCFGCSLCDNGRGVRCSYYDLLKGIDAADVRENVHGEWDKRDRYYWKCRNCDNDLRMTTDGLDNFDEAPNFCPWCGADMRGENDG